MGSEMYDLMSSSGPINSLKKNYNNVIDNLDDRIAAEEDRLKVYENMLKKRFAQLDAYISRMTQISQGFSAMVPKQE
jgi:flagellar hook-associated protein 2